LGIRVLLPDIVSDQRSISAGSGSGMRAIVVHAPGGPEALRLEERPVPQVRPGRVLVRVRAFGLNRAELITRAGGSGDAVTFPRVPGIECVGQVADPSDSGLEAGATVMAVMGGMGRDFDGGYEEYALLPAERVIPVRTSLDWPHLGTVPESFGTAWGSLETLNLGEGASLLVRGGSSSVGMAAITLAKGRGVVVFATTRQERKRARLEAAGADEVIIDSGAVGAQVRERGPGGVDAVLELVGPRTLLDSLKAVRRGGRVCLSGFLEDVWESGDAAGEAERLGVAFERFGSNALDRATYGEAAREIVAGVETGRYADILDRTFAMDEIQDAHRYMEANRAAGKVVVVTDEP
jgi:NADPH:quinone reductase-like Zn-dependent oxidoreductase